MVVVVVVLVVVVVVVVVLLLLLLLVVVVVVVVARRKPKRMRFNFPTTGVGNSRFGVVGLGRDGCFLAVKSIAKGGRTPKSSVL